MAIMRSDSCLQRFATERRTIGESLVIARAQAFFLFSLRHGRRPRYGVCGACSRSSQVRIGLLKLMPTSSPKSIEPQIGDDGGEFAAPRRLTRHLSHATLSPHALRPRAALESRAPRRTLVIGRPPAPASALEPSRQRVAGVSQPRRCAAPIALPAQTGPPPVTHSPPIQSGDRFHLPIIVTCL